MTAGRINQGPCNHYTVHASEREREEGRKREDERGGGRPTRAERGEKKRREHEQPWCSSLPSLRKSGVLQPNHAKEEKRHPGRPPERKEEKGEGGGRERERPKKRNPKTARQTPCS